MTVELFFVIKQSPDEVRASIFMDKVESFHGDKEYYFVKQDGQTFRFLQSITEVEVLEEVAT